jgi:hypothetical protein
VINGVKNGEKRGLAAFLLPYFDSTSNFSPRSAVSVIFLKKLIFRHFLHEKQVKKLMKNVSSQKRLKQCP